MYNISIAMAVLPVVLLCFYIYIKDKNKEPFGLLMKIFLLGVVMAVPVVIVELAFSYFFDTTGVKSFLLLFLFVFIGVGLIEEGAKFIIAKFIGYDNKEFDEIYDVVVYSAFASLGFACIENILYVLNSGLGVAIGRALLSVPGHMCFGVLMGYFLAMAKVNSVNNNKNLYYRNMIFALFIPALVHTMYDTMIIFASNIQSPMMFLLFIIFDINMVVVCFFTVSMISRMQVAIKSSSLNNGANSDKKFYFSNQETSKIVYCPVCGKYSVDESFCGRCGYKLK